MKIILPGNVSTIINTLNEAGFEAYAVGGCVRDSLMGRIPNDWDITTNASPEEVKALFRRTLDTGIEHGTVTVMFDKEGYEVTTYRIDGKYEDGRHPTEVTFTKCLKEDLLRRDFTINAMAYNDTEGLVDIFGGVEDIENKIIRCVGNPEARFSEDALRLLRAIRFAAQLSFTIEEETAEAMKKIAPNLVKISAERIQVELVKTVVSDNPGMIKDAYSLGLTKYFMPELDVAFETKQDNPHHCYSVGDHMVKAMEIVPAGKCLRLAMLLHDIEKPSCKFFDADGVAHFYGHPVKSAEKAKEILKRLKFDNDTIKRVCRLIEHHDERIEPGEKAMRRAMKRIGEDLFPDLMSVQLADINAQSDYKRDSKLARNEANVADMNAIFDSKRCVSLKSLAVTGKDLIAEGMKPGPGIGDVLEAMLDEVVENPEHNEREFLLSMFHDTINK